MKQAAAARAKARGSKVIEKWEDKERMTVNSNEDVLTCQLRLGEVAKVKSDDGKEVVVKNTKSGHVAVFCDKEEDISPELMEASVGLVAEQAKFYKTTGKYQAKVAICSSDTMTKEEAALGTTATSKLDYQFVEMSCMWKGDDRRCQRIRSSAQTAHERITRHAHPTKATHSANPARVISRA